MGCETGEARMTHWSDEYTQMLTDCENRESRMSEWECGFVDSLSKQIGDGRMPSRKQIEKLEDIWERVTSRG